MKIVVCLKQVFDTEAKIELNGSGQIASDGVQLIINPYDEFAVEEALQIKERVGGEVIVVAVGGLKPDEALRTALAMGADRAVLVEDEALQGGDAGTAALALSKVLEGLEYDLILGGQVAIDDNAAQVMSRVAERLNLPQINVVNKLEIAEGKAVGHRETDGATEIIEVPLPVVITAQKGLNEPRYPSLKGVMQAKKKEMKRVSLADLGLDVSQAGGAGAKTEVVEYFLPPARQTGKTLEGEPETTVKELVRLLREEAKAI